MKNADLGESTPEIDRPPAELGRRARSVPLAQESTPCQVGPVPVQLSLQNAGFGLVPVSDRYL